MSSLSFLTQALQHAATTHSQTSFLQIQLDQGATVPLSYGLVEQLHLILSPSPTAFEVAVVAEAAQAACAVPFTVPALRGILQIDEDSRRYAQQNEITLTIRNHDGSVYARTGFEISRGLDHDQWTLHLPEGDAPAGRLWNAVIAARLCSKAPTPSHPSSEKDSGVS